LVSASVYAGLGAFSSAGAWLFDLPVRLCPVPRFSILLDALERDLGLKLIS